jgi:type II secretory ATPase GspE/PulE/Tfp pilus assembly ATPase PilB-like protein
MCIMSTKLQELIQRRAPGSEIREQAIRDGMVPLRRAGWEKVAEGVTSISEVVRVTASELEVLDE